MSKGQFIYKNNKLNQKEPIDPRLPIARHINWIRPTSAEVLNSVPEPDNYNRAMRSPRPIECKFIADNVFYRDLFTDNWWSVYYVPEHQLKEYDAWSQQQSCNLLWLHEKPARLRPRHRLLSARKNEDITDNERLLTMGYYAKFSSKYFSNNDTMLLERLGTARSRVLATLDDVS